MPAGAPGFATRAGLRSDLERLGVGAGAMVMVHAAMRCVGPLIGGPDTLIGALRDAVGPGGTLLAATSWEAPYERLLGEDGRIAEAWRAHVPPFDPAASRAARENGAFAEFFRTTQGARRSGGAGSSIAALGARAAWVTADHAPGDGYGERSPLARLVEAGGDVVMIGAPFDTMTLLHLAESRARIQGKRRRRYEVPIADAEGVRWQMVEELESSATIVAGLPDDYFAAIVERFLDAGVGSRGLVGAAPSIRVDAAAITAFAVDWLERR